MYFKINPLENFFNPCLKNSNVKLCVSYIIIIIILILRIRFFFFPISLLFDARVPSAHAAGSFAKINPGHQKYTGP